MWEGSDHGVGNWTAHEEVVCEDDEEGRVSESGCRAPPALHPAHRCEWSGGWGVGRRGQGRGVEYGPPLAQPTVLYRFQLNACWRSVKPDVAYGQVGVRPGDAAGLPGLGVSIRSRACSSHG